MNRFSDEWLDGISAREWVERANEVNRALATKPGLPDSAIRNMLSCRRESRKNAYGLAERIHQPPVSQNG